MRQFMITDKKHDFSLFNQKIGSTLKIQKERKFEQKSNVINNLESF